VPPFGPKNPAFRDRNQTSLEFDHDSCGKSEIILTLVKAIEEPVRKCVEPGHEIVSLTADGKRPAKIDVDTSAQRSGQCSIGTLEAKIIGARTSPSNESFGPPINVYWLMWTPGMVNPNASLGVP
jgi:hypothetical protein